MSLSAEQTQAVAQWVRDGATLSDVQKRINEEFKIVDDLPPAIGTVALDVDNVTLIPGALASGSVTFSDGVTGKWIVDNQGRPGFTEVSQDGYQPTPEDAQEFMQQLGAALRAKGMA